MIDGASIPEEPAPSSEAVDFSNDSKFLERSKFPGEGEYSQLGGAMVPRISLASKFLETNHSRMEEGSDPFGNGQR